MQRIYIVTLFIILFQSIAFSESTVLNNLISQIELHLNQTKSMEANFTQITTHPHFGNYPPHKGKIIIQKPGLIRWEYTTPEKKIIVSEGESVSIYKPKENQMLVIRNAKKIQKQSPLAFLWGEGTLSDHFKDFTSSLDKKSMTSCVSMIPKTKRLELQSLELCIDDKFKINTIKITEETKSINTYQLSKIIENKKYPTKLFLIDIPKDTKVDYQ